MTPENSAGGAETPPAEAAARPHDHLVESLIDRLPGRVQTSIRWLRRPDSWWARVPAGVLLVIGGILSILPLLGIWMLPLGLMLLAEDFPSLRRLRNRILEWIARRRPQWFANDEAPGGTQPPSH